MDDLYHQSVRRNLRNALAQRPARHSGPSNCLPTMRANLIFGYCPTRGELDWNNHGEIVAVLVPAPARQTPAHSGISPRCFGHDDMPGAPRDDVDIGKAGDVVLNQLSNFGSPLESVLVSLSLLLE